MSPSKVRVSRLYVLILHRVLLAKSLAVAVLLATILLSGLAYAVVAAGSLALVILEDTLAPTHLRRLLVRVVLTIAIPVAVSGWAMSIVAASCSLLGTVLLDAALVPAARQEGAPRDGYALASGAGRLFCCFLALLVFGVLTSTALGAAAIIALAYLSARCTWAWWTLSRTGLRIADVHQRVLVGERLIQNVVIQCVGPKPVLLCVTSPHDWLQLHPVDEYRDGRQTFALSLTPTLSGPMTVPVTVTIVDNHGVFRRCWQQVTVLTLIVVPRARFAAYLARTYLAGRTTGPGGGGGHAQSSSLRAELLSTRLYQSGDSPSDIDWKRTLKFHTMVVREYVTAANVLVGLAINMECRNPEIADHLAMDMAISAITLAQSPATVSLTFYRNNAVLGSFPKVSGSDVVKLALAHLKDIVVSNNGSEVEGADLPDLHWLRQLSNKGDNVQLRALLAFRLRAIEAAAKQQVLSGVGEKMLRQHPGIGIVMSDMQSDSEAVALLRERCSLTHTPFLLMRPGRTAASTKKADSRSRTATSA